MIAFREKLVWIVVSALLIVIKMPGILNGRFWAEEGKVFFKNAWDLTPQEALFYSHGGYLNITANLAGLCANYLAPLEKACYVTSTFGFIFQICPLVLLCLSSQKWLQDRKTLLAAMMLIVSMPLAQEIWLSSIASQCHLNLCVALILALEPGTGPAGYFQKLLLVLAPLSGPGAILLVPLFALRSFYERTRARLIQTVILASASAIQLTCFWHPAARLQPSASATSVVGIDPWLLPNVFFVKHLLGPFMGMQESLDVAGGWSKAYGEGHFDPVPGAALAISVFCVFAVAVARSGSAESKWLLISGLLLGMLSYCGALGDRAMLLAIAVSERYTFAPQALFELSLLSLSCALTGGARTVCQALVVWLIVIGVHEYFVTPNFYVDGPIWRKEVHQWRQDPNYLLRPWPPEWSFHLKPHDKAPSG